ncbi:hypothetical protein AMQ84_16235 [Paenibacillus riograndensis]|uniref:Uncharacterized protein n=2 Tax=Paenibacillus riograndensis TaxID=483937 RepID=A0A132TX88_9BACL|nr:hypothetical protein [Paenibacillus riograndensis]KWX75902.1 hypothetical protein AMQ84_16235 [Paenibacillus riograndensis]
MFEKRRHIRIDADGWAEDIENAQVDVVVTFPDATRWISNFYTIKCIETMKQDYSERKVCLNGAYWCASSPVIIVDNISRERIEQVVDDLIQDGGFEYVFEYFGPVENRDMEASGYPEDFFDNNSKIDPLYVSLQAARIQQMLDQASEEVKMKIMREIFGVCL